MWNMPDVVVVADRSRESLLAHIIKLREERLRWPIIAKVVGLSEREALSIWVRSTMR
jgi:hypothetical protein